ncbi:MAG: hypothetical protein JXB50_15605 [Spirochaetes bacterium]|nr:hypothetical protein [Spirochaetota bacterium]
MSKKLNDEEIKITVNKIREKYRKIILDFNRTNAILEAFEDRYIRILKSHIDVSVFLLAEIEAVEEIYWNEEKKMKDKNERLAAKRRMRKKESYADKVMEENLKKIAKYDRVSICNNADEEIERLMGGVRDLINNYWPAVTVVLKHTPESSIKNNFNEFYHKLVLNYDYRGEVPVTKSYKYALQTIPVNNKKIEFERYYIIKETAFLLNDILSLFSDIIKNKNEILTDKKINVNIELDNLLKLHFDGLTHKEAIHKVHDYIKNIIADFRIRDIKREMK